MDRLPSSYAALGPRGPNPRLSVGSTHPAATWLTSVATLRPGAGHSIGSERRGGARRPVAPRRQPLVRGALALRLPDRLVEEGRHALAEVDAVVELDEPVPLVGRDEQPRVLSAIP